MLVFIDESGDPGFKVEKGSTPIFGAAMVLFDNAQNAQATELVIRQAMQLAAEPTDSSPRRRPK